MTLYIRTYLPEFGKESFLQHYFEESNILEMK